MAILNYTNYIFDKSNNLMQRTKVKEEDSKIWELKKAMGPIEVGGRVHRREQSELR